MPGDPPVNVLVFSPTPTHPTIQGNRQRVFDMCRAIQGVGADVTLLYYATEGVTAAAAGRMRESWGDLEVVFPRGFVHRRGFVRHPAIDDWFDDAITAAVAKLCSQKHFDVCIVNYVWYSKLFDALPGHIVRVLDTHDVFGARAQRFTEIGLDPAWFHTSVTQETIGLDRANFVVAIQDVEAATFRDRTNSAVRTVGFLSPGNFLPIRKPRSDGRLRIGYLGSGNPFNVASMLAFTEVLRRRDDVAARLDVCVAGQICSALNAIPHPFELRGIVDSAIDFYRSVDVVINPMLGGTGLKIKSLEALSFGKPLVATAAGMVGIASDNPGHQLEDAEAVVDHLAHLADEPGLLIREAASARQVFRHYGQVQSTAFLALWSEITAAAKPLRTPGPAT